MEVCINDILTEDILATFVNLDTTVKCQCYSDCLFSICRNVLFYPPDSMLKKSSGMNYFCKDDKTKDYFRLDLVCIKWKSIIKSINRIKIPSIVRFISKDKYLVYCSDDCYTFERMLSIFYQPTYYEPICKAIVIYSANDLLTRFQSVAEKSF